MLTPGLVFASDPAYATAIAATVDRDVSVVLTQGAVEGRDTLRRSGGDGADGAGRRRACRVRDTIAKFLFTSGSTKLPRA